LGIPRSAVVLDRRLRVMELSALGVKPKRIIDQIVWETGCSEAIAWKTWRSREEWMPVLVGIPKYDMALVGLFRDLQEVRRLSFKLYFNTESSRAKVATLRNVTRSVFMEFRMRMKLGLCPQVHGKLEEKAEFDFEGWWDMYGDAMVNEGMRRLLPKDKADLVQENMESVYLQVIQDIGSCRQLEDGPPLEA